MKALRNTDRRRGCLRVGVGQSRRDSGGIAALTAKPERMSQGPGPSSSMAPNARSPPFACVREGRWRCRRAGARRRPGGRSDSGARAARAPRVAGCQDHARGGERHHLPVEEEREQVAGEDHAERAAARRGRRSRCSSCVPRGASAIDRPDQAVMREDPAEDEAELVDVEPASELPPQKADLRVAAVPNLRAWPRSGERRPRRPARRTPAHGDCPAGTASSAPPTISRITKAGGRLLIVVVLLPLHGLPPILATPISTTEATKPKSSVEAGDVLEADVLVVVHEEVERDDEADERPMTHREDLEQASHVRGLSNQPGGSSGALRGTSGGCGTAVGPRRRGWAWSLTRTSRVLPPGPASSTTTSGKKKHTTVRSGGDGQGDDARPRRLLDARRACPPAGRTLEERAPDDRQEVGGVEEVLTKSTTSTAQASAASTAPSRATTC